MVTNRLKFYNVDQSASLPQPSAITAYTVVKASRGSTVPMFFGAINFDLFAVKVSVVVA